MPNTKPETTQPPKEQPDACDRRERQAAALRDNLLRRKAQARARRDRDNEPTRSG